ncbi:hypothetical protein ACF3MZ_13190 [Paenibacillaceae bacterium WGS1546]|uniref:hypothetical protein n=1 Tax=Cohnella sp. WGS1546 TaxID=3366810 RepID=UPI00372D4203
MRRDMFKLLIFAGVVGFAILYGMELSSKGIESVRGPWEESVESPAPEDDGSDWTLPVREGTDGDRASGGREPVAEEPPVGGAGLPGEPFIPRNDREPIVDRVSGKTAEVLHDLSRGGIRMVVSLFDKMLG